MKKVLMIGAMLLLAIVAAQRPAAGRSRERCS